MRNLNSGKLRRLLAALLVAVMACGLIAAGTMPELTEPAAEETDVQAAEALDQETLELDAEEAEEAEAAADAEEAEAPEDAAVAEGEADAEEASEEDSSAVVFGTGVPEEKATASEKGKMAPKAPLTVPVRKMVLRSASTGGVELDKTAEYDAESDSVKIKLKSYVTGASVITEEAAPMDFLLILDKSKSMTTHQMDTGEDRLDVMKRAVNNFLDTVSTTGDEHRVAVVEFSTNGTERTLQNFKTPASMDKTADGKYSIIEGIEASGGTYTDYGVREAQTVLNSRQGEDATRPCVVVLFTDGAPTAIRNASTAINILHDMKQSADIYCIGVVNGLSENKAAVMPTSFNYSAWKTPDNTSDATWNGYADDPRYGIPYEHLPVNTVMHAMSSNYPDAYVHSSNGTVIDPSTDLGDPISDSKGNFFFAVENAAQLENAFQTIASESGGASTALTEDTVVNDSVTPYFTVPENASGVTLKTSAFRGEEGWADPVNAEGASASISGNKLHVTGFNFSENWVGYTTQTDGTKTPRGKQLIVEFTVPVEPLYLGGSQTQTNGEDSGLYENSTAADPVARYDVPHVAVPLKAVKPAIADKNIYLTTDADVVSGLITNSTTFTVGEGAKEKTATFTELFNGVNNANVDVSFALKDEDGNVLGTYTVKHGETTGSWTWTGGSQPALTGDKYTLSSSVKDVISGETKDVAVTATINVFKPEFTFNDQTKYYGDEITFPTPNATWKHGDTLDSDVTMDTAKPAVSIVQNRDGSTKKVGDTEYVIAKEDFPVSVTISVGGQDVTDLLFSENKISRACDADASHTDTSKAETFVVHVKTVSLTVTKLVDGLFANKSRDYGFQISFSHPALTLDDETFALKDTQSKELNGLPMGATVTIQETDVPSAYIVKMNEVEGNPQDVVLNAASLDENDNLTVEVQNVLESIPITGVLAGHGPEVLLGFFAALTLAGFITVKVLNRRYER